MKAIRWAFVFAATAALSAGAAKIGQPEDGLVVHEWGTFTSVAGHAGEAVVWQPLVGPPDLPCFVNHLGIRNLKGVPATIRMETPVIYFYAPHPLTASVRVRFPQGKITEWYPQASRSSDSAMEWNGVNVLPDTQLAFPVDKRGNSHYYAARETDAAALRIGKEEEKLIFYRGVGNFAVPLRPRFVAEGRVLLNAGASEIPAAVLFENRGGKIAFRALGAVRGEMTANMPADGSVDSLRQQMQQILISQGLYAREAQAMLETWRDSWFEQGVRVLYIVPRETVDAVLPLDITPKPSAMARVFVGRVELRAPWMQQEIGRAIAEDDPAIAAAYGRFLQPFLDGKQPGPRVRAYMDAAWGRIFSTGDRAGGCR